MEIQEWDVLSYEEQQGKMDEKPEGAEVKTSDDGGGKKEDVVIIDGKPRPLKNFMAEMQRKVKEDILSEMKPAETPPANQRRQPIDYLAQIEKEAEAEIGETGKIIPIQTMSRMIGQAAGYYVNRDRENTKAAKKVIRETKSELKSQYKDFSENESRFDNIIDEIDPSQITKQGLKIVFNSLRGENVEERIKKATDLAVKEALAGKKIIGDTATSTTSKTPAPSGKLTPTQIKEMQDMNFTSEEDYFGRLKKYQAIAKQKGAKNVPELISEQLIIPKKE